MKLPLPAAFGLLVLSTGSVLAQGGGPVEYTLKLSPQQLMTVAKALTMEAQAYKDSAVLLNEIQKQADEQTKAAQKAAAPPALPAPAVEEKK